jgi:hypothetical protein
VRFEESITSLVKKMADRMVGISNAKEKYVCFFICSVSCFSSWPITKVTSTYSI